MSINLGIGGGALTRIFDEAQAEQPKRRLTTQRAVFRRRMDTLLAKTRIVDTPIPCPLFLVRAGDRTLINL